MVELAPGARLDLSLSPRLKLAVGADLAWLRFTGADFQALGGRAGAEARLLLRRVDLSLALTGDRSEYSRAVPLADLSAAPSITSTAAVALTPGIPFRAGPLAIRAAAGASTRRSEADTEVAERALALDAGLEWRAHPRLEVQAAAQHERVASARPDFARVSTGGEAALSAVALEEGPLEIALHARRDRVRFDTGLEETLSRIAVDLTHPLGPVVAVVAWSWSRSDAEGAASASRHLLYAGVRARVRALSW